MPELTINGEAHERRRSRRDDAGRDAARRARPDRDEDRLRRGPLRRVHGAPRRRARLLVHHARAHGRRARGDDDRRAARAPARRRVRPQRTRSSAASARPGRSSPPRRSSRATRSPSSDEIRHAMAGNLCRCGTYPKIEEAISDMARLIRTEKEVEGRFEEVWLVVEEDALEQWPAGPREIVGRPAQRVTGPMRARGEARYTSDLQAARDAARGGSPVPARARAREEDLARAGARRSGRAGRSRPRRRRRPHRRARPRGPGGRGGRRRHDRAGARGGRADRRRVGRPEAAARPRRGREQADSSSAR